MATPTVEETPPQTERLKTHCDFLSFLKKSKKKVVPIEPKNGTQKAQNEKNSKNSLGKFLKKLFAPKNSGSRSDTVQFLHL